MLIKTNTHDFLKDSKNSDIFAILTKAKTEQERCALLKELYKSVHDREHPDIDTFLFDKRFLGLGKSEVRPNILKLLHLIHDDPTIFEAQLLLGSGSGKSWLTVGTMAYKTHEIMSYVDPALYFGLSSGSPLAIVNMAINAPQAMNVIFKLYRSFINKIKSFENIARKEKILLKSNTEIDFDENFTDEDYQKEKFSEALGKIYFLDKNFMAVSGHSKAESFYGYSIYNGCVDECDFVRKTMSIKKKTDYEDATSPAEEVIAGLSKAIKSRFGLMGLLLLISTIYGKIYPLTRRVIETQRLGQEINIDDGTIIVYRDTLPDDRIKAYRNDDKLAVIGATWHFTNIPRSEYIKDEKNIIQLRDYGCIPPESAFGALPDPQIIERMCNYERKSPLTDDQFNFYEWFDADPKSSYYVHLDLALTGDNAGISMTHKNFDSGKYIADFMMEIITSKDRPMMFSRVKTILLVLKQRSFNIACVSIDGWQSAQLQQDLAAMGFYVVLLSVDRSRSPYETLIECLCSGLLDYYYHETFITEMKYLQDFGDKFDHPERFPTNRKGSKDVADSVAGALYMCITSLKEIILTIDDINRATKEVLNLNGNIIVDGEETPVCVINENDVLVWNIRPVPNLYNRSAFVNSTDKEIILLIGYKYNDIFYIDFVQTFDPNDDYEIDLHIILKGLNVDYVGLGNLTTYTIIEMLRRFNIRTISKDMNISDKSKNKHVRAITNVTYDYVQNMFSMIKKGGLKICNDPILIRDLLESGEKNYKEKKFTMALASWLYYMLQDQRGLSETIMPAPIFSSKQSNGIIKSTLQKNNNAGRQEKGKFTNMPTPKIF